MKTKWLLLTLTVSFLMLTVPTFAQVDITFKLNTSTGVGITDSASVVQVRGDKAPLTWDDSSIDMISLGGDYWEVTITFHDSLVADILEFQLFADDWEGVSNATVPLDADSILAMRYFKNSNTLPYTATDSIDVFFRVNVGSAYELDAFDTVEGVFIAGSLPPLDWGNNPIALTQETGDTMIWSGIVSFNDSMAAKTLAYKFVLGSGPRSWEDLPSDRNVAIPAADSTVQWVFWEDTEATGEPLLSGNLLFTMDMNSYMESGAFDPTGGDIIRVVGGFQNWDNADDAGVDMTDQGGGLYELLLAYESAASTGNEFKFFIDYDSAAHADWLDFGMRGTFGDTESDPSWWGWELPVNVGGGNRLFDWAGGNVTIEGVGFNAIPLEGVIPAATTIDVTFSVDMVDAMLDPDAPFVPATDSLWIQFPEQIWTGMQGMPSLEQGQNDPANILTDSDGDGIYTRTITVNGPAHYGMTYFYSYHTVVGSNVVGEGGGFSFGRYRGRFIEGFSDGTWPATFELPVDTLDPTGAPLVVEDNPVFGSPPIGVDDKGVTPRVFALKQNYPNPFNPSTSISYSIPEISDVKISIFNLLGQEIFTQNVGTVVPGSYEFKWNGVDNGGVIMASGVYFYKLSAGTHSATKKMVLLK